MAFHYVTDYYGNPIGCIDSNGNNVPIGLCHQYVGKGGFHSNQGGLTTEHSTLKNHFNIHERKFQRFTHGQSRLRNHFNTGCNCGCSGHGQCNSDLTTFPLSNLNQGLMSFGQARRKPINAKYLR